MKCPRVIADNLAEDKEKTGGGWNEWVDTLIVFSEGTLLWNMGSSNGDGPHVLFSEETASKINEEEAMEDAKEELRKECNQKLRAEYQQWIKEKTKEKSHPPTLEEKNEWLFEKMVPSSGPADTTQGELLRAFNKMRYRLLNDGDLYHEFKKEYLDDKCMYREHSSPCCQDGKPVIVLSRDDAEFWQKNLVQVHNLPTALPEGASDLSDDEFDTTYGNDTDWNNDQCEKHKSAYRAFMKLVVKRVEDQLGLAV